MMKKYLFNGGLLALGLIAVGFSVYGLANGTQSNPADGIQFIEGSWSKALTQAKKENKRIFVDAYASWCGPCKLLKKNTFTQKEAGDFFNKNFVNVAIDMEEGEGPALSDKFQITAYPTLIIADKDGNVITYTKGYMNAAELVKFGKYALDKH